MPGTKGKDDNRFYFIDALRASMILIVFEHALDGRHVTELAEFLPNFLSVPLFHTGHFAVSLFFIISGFVIAHNLSPLVIDLKVAGKFLLRRSLRLDPPYWAAIMLMCALAYVSYRTMPGKEPPAYSATALVAHLFYLQDLLGIPQIDIAYWTLCIEFQFYTLIILVFFVLGGKLIEGNLALRCAVILLTLFSLLWPLGILKNSVPGLIAPRLYEFLFGVVCYWAYKDPPVRRYFVLSGGALLLWAIYTANSFLVFDCVTSMLLFFMSVSQNLSAGKNWRPLQFLGKISYSMYLTHNPITGAMFRIGYLSTGRYLWSEVLWLIVTVAVVVLFAFGWWRFIEKPSTRLSQKIRLSKPAVLDQSGAPTSALPIDGPRLKKLSAG